MLDAIISTSRLQLVEIRERSVSSPLSLNFFPFCFGTGDGFNKFVQKTLVECDTLWTGFWNRIEVLSIKCSNVDELPFCERGAINMNIIGFVFGDHLGS